ncbi:MAG: prepilin-type N-terminal cleavage/methylation domain-containing protein [Fimbriimonadales bacterium]
MRPNDLRRAFTLLETLSVVAIIAALTAIITPIYSAAILGAKTQSSIQRLRQFHVAISLYQSQWDFKGYDSVEALALPDVVAFTTMFPRHMYGSPCGWNQAFSPDNANVGWAYIYSEPLPWGLKVFRQYRQNSVLVIDYQCNGGAVGVADPLAHKRVLGLLLSGEVVNRWTTGDVYAWSTYTKPPDP